MKRILLALLIAGPVQAEVTALGAEALVANTMYVGCINAEAKKPDAVAVDLLTRSVKTEEYRARVAQGVSVGARWHHDNPSSDCTQIYINVIDNLALGEIDVSPDLFGEK